MRREHALDPCVRAAAAYHRINVWMLVAILHVESDMRDDVIARNRNGSIDIGRGGVNSIHLQDLARYGVLPRDLLDGCKNTYVAAWLVRRSVARSGETLSGYAGYHSRTPYQNARYQVLLANELVRMGVVRGRVQPVPPLPASARRRSP